MKRASTTRLLAFGFLLTILIGTALLCMPFSIKEGKTDLLIALFTATSATCVTGLAAADTYTHWTAFGQAVIFCLIQIGGLGFMTIGVYVSVLLKKKIGLHERENIHESVNTLELAGVVKLTKRIIHGTLLIEGIGALLLSIRFIPQFGPVRGILFSIFHSVSAFCNAGFDLMGINEKYSSFAAYENDTLVNFVFVALILTGGIGFIVWDDLWRNKWHWKKYLLHTKIVLSTTFFITVIGTILFLLIENNGVFAGMNPWEKFLGALFSSVTPRTAGFNTVDTAALSKAGKLLTIILMFIGGSPGSTAGGCKTTTLIVLLLYAAAMIRNHQDITMFGRRFESEVVKKANAVVIINFTITLVASFLIMCMQDFSFEDIFLEAFSATCTVGMTTGITRDLSVLSKLILIICMYCGRLGSLSFALVFAQNKKQDTVRLPQEKIVVG